MQPVFLVIILAVCQTSGETPQDDQPSVPALVQMLGADRFEDRRDAAQKLLKMGESVGNTLEEVARSSDDPEIREQAIQLLRKLPGKHRWITPPKFDPSRAKPIVKKAGEIAANETWFGDKSYLITSDLKVIGKAVVTIEQGTMVFVADDVSIEVDKEAAFVARARDHWDPVVITSDAERTGTDGSWGKLIVRGGLGLENVQVRKSSGIVYANELGRKLGMDGILILDTKGDALTFYDNASNLGEISIRNTDGTALVFERGSNPRLTRLEVSGAKKGILGNRGYLNADVISVSNVDEEAILLKSGDLYVAKTLSICKCSTAMHFDGGSTGGSVGGTFNSVQVSDCAESGVLITHSNPVFSSLTIERGKKSGVHIAKESYPVIGSLILRDISGTALMVDGKSVPQIGTLEASRCSSPDRVVEQGSVIRSPSGADPNDSLE